MQNALCRTRSTFVVLHSAFCIPAIQPSSKLNLRLSSLIPHPSSLILHPSSFILHPSSFIPHPSSLIRHSARIADPMLLLALWLSLAPLQTPRQEVAVAAAGGRVYVFGGISGDEVLDSVEEYDPVANRWRFVAPLPE